MDKIKEYIGSVSKEMSKVSWPSQSELKDNTVVVIFFSVLLSVFIFALDRLYSFILESIL